MNWEALFGLNMPTGYFDVLTIGETVVDLISVEETDDLYHARSFERFQGGSPANIALNIAKLQGKAALVSIVGKDGFGRFIRETLYQSGVDVRYLFEDDHNPTTVNIISRTPGTADSIHLRFADYQLSSEHINREMIANTRIVHASTFALSCEPSRTAIEKAFILARELGKLVSLDPNYNQIDWKSDINARDLLTHFFKYVHITKPSLDDAARLFGAGLTPTEYIRLYHSLGPCVVILTMGNKGTILSVNGEQTAIPAREVKVVDATGAGDAFWAGFLAALLDQKSLLECVLFGREIVEMGLSIVGPIQMQLNRELIYYTVEREMEKLSNL